MLFAAITGIPLVIPRAADGSPDWNALLGTPATDPNNFCARSSSTAIRGMSAEGVISMRQADRDADPACTERVVPACRREGRMNVPGACAANPQYFAWPARRIVEVARRFDQAPLCAGTPCHNGVVGSICAGEYAPALNGLVDRIQARRH